MLSVIVSGLIYCGSSHTFIEDWDTSSCESITIGPHQAGDGDRLLPPKGSSDDPSSYTLRGGSGGGHGGGSGHSGGHFGDGHASRGDGPGWSNGGSDGCRYIDDVWC